MHNCNCHGTIRGAKSRFNDDRILLDRILFHLVVDIGFIAIQRNKLLLRTCTDHKNLWQPWKRSKTKNNWIPPASALATWQMHQPIAAHQPWAEHQSAAKYMLYINTCICIYQSSLKVFHRLFWCFTESVSLKVVLYNLIVEPHSCIRVRTIQKCWTTYEHHQNLNDSC